MKVASADERWAAEATRLYRRYEIEIEQALGLCPWAEPARRAGKVGERVVLDPRETSLEFPPHIEVAVLIFPRLNVGPSEFDRFVARLRDEDAARHPLGAIPFAMAAFHPDAPLDKSQPERLIPFLRRTPDPTIQIVRTTVLDRVRSGAPQGTSFVNFASLDLAAAAQPPLRERIARANLARVEQVGVAEVERKLADIRRDREETYARLAL